MKALVYLGPGTMEYRETAKPEGAIILKILGSGVCGTDIKTFLKGHHMFTPPTVLGHECIGVVEKAPRGCCVAEGDLVAVAPYVECGVCGHCRKGLGQLCRNKSYVSGGCFAEYIAMDESFAKLGLFLIPDSDPDPVYTLAEPLACVINGMKKLNLDSGRKVLIVGSGPMGSLFGTLLESLGTPFAVVEPSPFRQKLISGWGWEILSEAEAGASPGAPSGASSGTSPGEAVRGRNASLAGAGPFDQIVLTVNRSELVQKYIGAAADGGNVLLFSGFSRSDTATVDPFDIHYREVSVTGTFGYARGHFIEALDVIDREGPRFGRLITHRLPLDRGLEAMALLQKGEAMKVVLEP